jgi:hypothetical protein
MKTLIAISFALQMAIVIQNDIAISSLTMFAMALSWSLMMAAIVLAKHKVFIRDTDAVVAQILAHQSKAN